MNKHKNSDINWLNIITIRDFKSCIDLISLKEISMTSKIAREKLKPVIFQCLALKCYDLMSMCSSSCDNIIFEFYKRFYLPDFGTSLSVNEKDWNIQNDLNEISSDLIRVGKYAKIFNLDGLDRAGYFLYRIINNFHSLKFLELRLCFIPYLEFVRIGESLPNLTSIKLISLHFTILPTNNITLDKFIFPHKLSYLELYCCRTLNSSLISNPYEFLFNEVSTQETDTRFNIPNICVPSLKQLVFYTHYTQDGELEEFLTTNPNLESVNIDSYNLHAIKSLNSLNSLEIRGGINFEGRNSINALKSLKKLEIEIEGDSNYDSIKNLCMSCYNLEYLHITMRNIVELQKIIDTCVAPIVANFSLLKTLQLIAHKEEYDPIDISKFSQIEKLIIKSSSTTLLNIDFASCSNFKSIELTSYSDDIEKSMFSYKFTTYKNWIFKYFKHTIRGYKLNN